MYGIYEYKKRRGSKQSGGALNSMITEKGKYKGSKKWGRCIRKTIWRLTGYIFSAIYHLSRKKSMITLKTHDYFIISNI